MAYEELCLNFSFIIVLLLFFIDPCRKTITFVCPPKGLNLLLLYLSIYRAGITCSKPQVSTNVCHLVLCPVFIMLRESIARFADTLYASVQMVSVSYWINPAEKLVTRALNKWRAKMMKADNISCVVVLIDPLGPSKLTILRKRRDEHFQKLQEAKAAAAAARVSSASAPGASHAPSGPSTSTATSKANHNQNNLGGRENRGGGGEATEGKANVENKDSSVDAENKAQKSAEDEASSNSGHCGEGSSAGGNAFTGRDITSSTNQTHSHSLRSSSHSPTASNRSLSKAASASKVGQSHRASHQADPAVRYPLLPRRLSHPTLTSKPSDMDDSVQASSSLAISPPYNTTLSPTSEDALLPGPNSGAGGEGSIHKLTSPMSMSMSDSLLKLMNLDAVKASTDPLPKSNTPHSSVLGQSHLAGQGVKGSGGSEQRRPKRSNHGVLQNSTRQHHSSLLSSSVDVNQTLPPTTHALGKNYHSTRSLNHTLHTTQSLDKTFHSTRILRVATSQRSSSKTDKPSTDAKASSPDKDDIADGSKSLKVGSLIQSASGSSIKKAKRRHDFGLLHRTRTTLRRARRAACKAFCPENRPFLKQLPGSKRKRDEKHLAPDTPSTKRLKRSDGLRYSM